MPLGKIPLKNVQKSSLDSRHLALGCSEICTQAPWLCQCPWTLKFGAWALVLLSGWAPRCPNCGHLGRHPLFPSSSSSSSLDSSWSPSMPPFVEFSISSMRGGNPTTLSFPTPCCTPSRHGKLPPYPLHSCSKHVFPLSQLWSSYLKCSYQYEF